MDMNYLENKIIQFEDIFSLITGYRDKEIYVIETAEIDNLIKETKESPIIYEILDHIKNKPHTAKCFKFHLINGEIQNLIYIPDKLKKTTLDILLDISEEIFHAVNPINDEIVDETLAALARYIAIRIGEKEGIIITDEMKKISKAIGYSIGITKKEDYMELKPLQKIDEKYIYRLYLVGLIVRWDTMSFEDVIKEFQEIYDSVKISEDPLNSIEKIGKLYNIKILDS